MKGTFRFSRLTFTLMLLAFLDLWASSGPVLAQCAPPAGPPPCPPPGCPAPACLAIGPPVCPVAGLTVTGFAPSVLAWAPVPAACAPATYDVARGDLDCLRNNCTMIGGTCPTCLPGEDGAFGAIAVDPGAPLAGQGFWYLVRWDGVPGPGAGSW